MASFTAPTYDNELLYFNIEGKAEAIRLACSYASIPLKDTRFQDSAEFIQMKESGKLRFGQVPALVVTNKSSNEVKTLVQTNAIIRFLAKQDPNKALYSEDPIISANIDALLDAENDLFAGIGVARYKERFGFGFLEGNQELLDQVYTQINSEVLPRHLANLDRVLNESKTGWLANTPTPTIADFVFAPRLKWLRSGIDGIPTTVLDGFECITTFLDKFYNLPEIAAYYK